MCKCERCDFVYRSEKENTGCKIGKGYFHGGKWYKPVKVGELGDFCEGEGKDARCHDCGSPMGSYHHVNCDAERCPICGGQFWTCGCFDNEYEELMFSALKKILENVKGKKNISENEIKNILDEHEISNIF